MNGNDDALARRRVAAVTAWARVIAREQDGLVEQLLSVCITNRGELCAENLKVQVDLQLPEPAILVHMTRPGITCSGSIALPRMAAGGTVLREKERRTVYLLSVVLLWLVVFALPMPALDPEPVAEGSDGLGDQEAALIAFAAGYTFWILGRMKTARIPLPPELGAAMWALTGRAGRSWRRLPG